MFCACAAALEEQGTEANSNEQSQGGSGLVDSPSRRLDGVGISRGLSRAVYGGLASGSRTRTGSLRASARSGGGTAADGQSGAGANRGLGLVRVDKVQNKSRVGLLLSVPEALVAGPAVGRIVPEGGASLEHGVAGADLAAVAGDAAAGIGTGDHELRESAGHGVEELIVRVAQAGAAVVDVAVPRAGLAVGDAGALPDVVVAGALALEHDCRDWVAVRAAESDFVGSIGEIGDLISCGLAGTASEDDGWAREEGDGCDEVRRDVHFGRFSEKMND